MARWLSFIEHDLMPFPSRGCSILWTNLSLFGAELCWLLTLQPLNDMIKSLVLTKLNGNVTLALNVAQKRLKQM